MQNRVFTTSTNGVHPAFWFICGKALVLVRNQLKLIQSFRFSLSSTYVKGVIKICYLNVFSTAEILTQRGGYQRFSRTKSRICPSCSMLSICSMHSRIWNIYQLAWLLLPVNVVHSLRLYLKLESSTDSVINSKTFWDHFQSIRSLLI